MVDREKRRKFIKKIVRFWFKHNLAIAVSLAAIFIGTTITVICVCLNSTAAETIEEPSGDYSSVLGDINSNSSAREKKTKKIITSSGTDDAEEEIEYQTVLQYNASTRNGYMNNCIFLGDSRTVAMVSYGFVSDENVLAKVGISHPAVLSTKFTQNSGKEYTVKDYLASHKAPVIYLAFGVNGMGGSEEKYQQSFKELVEKIMEYAPESEIVIMAIGPVDDNGPYKKTCQNSWINKYNEFLTALAEYEGIYYLDVDSVLKGSDGQVKLEYDAGDGLHYRACAYTVILDYIIHHPVPGVSDDGEFVVKYVKPTGQFKKMMTETTTLPDNVQVVDDASATVTSAVTAPVAEAIPSIIPTPSVEVQQKKEEPVVQQQTWPTLSPSPTIIATPAITVAPVNNPTITEEVTVTSTPTPVVVEEPTPTSNPEVIEEPTPTPTPVVEELTPTSNPEVTEESTPTLTTEEANE